MVDQANCRSSHSNEEVYPSVSTGHASASGLCCGLHLCYKPKPIVLTSVHLDMQHLKRVLKAYSYVMYCLQVRSDSQ